MFSSLFAPLFSRRVAGSCQRNLFSTSGPRLYARSRLYFKWPSSHSIATCSAPAKVTLPLLCNAAGISAVGLGISFFATPTVHCDAVSTAFTPSPPLPPPESSVNRYELGFGTICGFCAGIFVKKGAKALAFVLGGVFVLLQYLGSLSVVRVDWVRMGSRFENLFFTTDADGRIHPPSVSSTWRWLIDFLTADFQKRASFIAGLALGLRVG